MPFARQPISSRRFSDIHCQVRRPSSEEFYNASVRLPSNILSKNKTSGTQPPRNCSTDSAKDGNGNALSIRLGAGKDLNADNLAALWPSADGDSDPEPSVYDVSAFDFPEPPPMGTPVIRKMRSSPWFLHENEWDRDTVIHHWRSSVPMGPTTISRAKGLRSALPVAQDLGSEEAYWRDQTDSDLSIEGCLGLEPFEDGHLALELDSSQFCLGSFAMNNARRSDITRQPSSRATPMFIRNTVTDLGDLNDARNNNKRFTCEAQLDTTNRPLSALPRIIRKVASMRSDNPKGNKENHIPVSHGRTIPKSRSFRSMLRPHETEQALRGDNRSKGQSMWTTNVIPHTDERGVCSSTNFRDGQMLVNNTKNQQGPRQYLDSPNGSDHALDKRSSRYFSRDVPMQCGLEAPFPQQNEQQKTKSITNADAAKSFINMTPKQGIKDKVGVQRERVKKMVSKASSSWLGWGKWKTKTGTTSS